jgi:hypothetical protein
VQDVRVFIRGVSRSRFRSEIKRTEDDGNFGSKFFASTSPVSISDLVLQENGVLSCVAIVPH